MEPTVAAAIGQQSSHPGQVSGVLCITTPHIHLFSIATPDHPARTLQFKMEVAQTSATHGWVTCSRLIVQALCSNRCQAHLASAASAARLGRSFVSKAESAAMERKPVELSMLPDNHQNGSIQPVITGSTQNIPSAPCCCVCNDHALTLSDSLIAAPDVVIESTMCVQALERAKHTQTENTHGACQVPKRETACLSCSLVSLNEQH